MSDGSASGRNAFASSSKGSARPERHVVSARTQSVGLWLFLLSLSSLFASGMLAYVVVRIQMSDALAIGENRPIIADWKLFTSTIIVISASLAIHIALRAVKRERQVKFRRWLWITNILALMFLIVQTPAMIQLLALDPGAGPALEQMTGPRPTRLWTILAFFVFVHAAHVFGGVIYLIQVTIKTYRGRYDHEHFVGVRHAALYWHFLDVVWLVMFGTFLVLG